jgi:serine/threonine protein kinase
MHKLHLLNIVHNDIKPSNLMFNKNLNKWIFIDFGCARILR